MIYLIRTAKKFKKAWVDKAKIKSQWKAQKRKEGLIEKTRLNIPTYRGEDEDEVDQEEPEGGSETRPSNGEGTQEKPHRNATQMHPSRDKWKSKEGILPESRTVKKPRDNEEDNVRGLMREAYSKSSLHTFRSDPLKKHAASRKSKGEKGKGQPDMGLRMKAMLAKIKRDYA